MTKSRVSAFGRIHCGLIDLTGATGRAFGGSGFAVDSHKCVVEARSLNRAKSVQFVGVTSNDEIGALNALVERFNYKRKPFLGQIEVVQAIPAHHGLGSKTALYLSVVKALALATGQPLSRLAIQRISRRGGASGIGIHSFFEGGFIVDGGHEFRSGMRFVPSAYAGNHEVPPRMIRVPFPRNWEVQLLMGRGLTHSGSRELAFFRRNAPLPGDESMTSLAATYHMLALGVKTVDLETVRRGLRALQTTGFKMREIANQHRVIGDAMESIYVQSCRCAVGMSSMGPTIFVIYESRDATTRAAVRKAAAANKFLSVIARGSNRGHLVEVE